jgi:general secretion pathway protein A
MYLDFYQLKSAPFQNTPDPTLLFVSASHKAALDALAAGIANRQGVVVITGAPGVGKTTLVHAYLARVAPSQLTTVVLWQARLSFREILVLLARRFDVPVQMDALGAMLTQLQQRFRDEAQQGCSVALLIDEAQDLPLETLEQLPLLVPLTASQEPLLQIVLVGQPSLLRHLRRRRLRRVAQRSVIWATIRPLTKAESLAYIRQRVARVALPGGSIFTQGALQTIVRYARGVPQDVNALCTNVLQAGYWARQQPITADLVRQVLAVTRGSKSFPLGRLGLATAIGLVLVAGLLWVTFFSAGPQAIRSGPAPRVHSQNETPQPTSALLPVAPLLQEPESAPPAASTPDNTVGHGTDEDHARLGPPEVLERQRLETPSVTLTPPAPAVPPPAATLPPRAIPSPPASSKGTAFKACDELKAEIKGKLDAKGVTGYVLTIIASGDAQGHRIVGSCEGNTKKIALHRLRQAP